MQKYTDEYLRAYVMEQLAPEERAAFEEVLAADDELQKRTDEFRDLAMIAELSQQERTRELLRTLQEEDRPNQKQWWWKGLVLLVLLAGGAWIGLNENFWGGVTGDPSSDFPTETPQQPPAIDKPTGQVPDEAQPEKQVAPDGEEVPESLRSTPLNEGTESQEEGGENTEPLLFAALLRDAAVDVHEIPPRVEDSRNTTGTDTLDLAYAALQERQPQKAISFVLPLIRRDAAANTARYYLANAYFLDKQYDESVRQFKLLREAPGAIDPDALDWYLLLAILARDNAESQEAELLFEKMLDPEAFHNRALPAKTLKQNISEK